MKKRISFLLAAALGASAMLVSPAMAAKGTLPIISGNYVLTEVDNCVNSATSFSQETVLASFNPNTGAVTFNGYKAGGNPLTLGASSGSGTYSNTATTLTLNGNTFQVIYGKLAGGKATYLSYIGIEAGDNGPCGEQGWLQLQ